mgnify:CR=1 FL=1
MKAIKIEAIPIFLGKGRWTWRDHVGSLADYAAWLREQADSEIRDFIQHLHVATILEPEMVVVDRVDREDLGKEQPSRGEAVV